MSKEARAPWELVSEGEAGPWPLGADLKVSTHSSVAAEWGYEGGAAGPAPLPLRWWCKMASPGASGVVRWWVLMSGVGDMPQGVIFEPNPSHTLCGSPVRGRRESNHCPATG